MSKNGSCFKYSRRVKGIWNELAECSDYIKDSYISRYGNNNENEEQEEVREEKKPLELATINHNSLLPLKLILAYTHPRHRLISSFNVLRSS